MTSKIPLLEFNGAISQFPVVSLHNHPYKKKLYFNAFKKLYNGFFFSPQTHCMGKAVCLGKAWVIYMNVCPDSCLWFLCKLLVVSTHCISADLCENANRGITGFRLYLRDTNRLFVPQYPSGRTAGHVAQDHVAQGVEIRQFQLIH